MDTETHVWRASEIHTQERANMTVRLCLVRVKAFPENIPSSGNAIFRKGKCFHVFGCISKKFPKNIFWCLEKKEKTNPEKYGQNPDWRSTLDWVWCTASLREIAIDGAISRSVNRDLAKHRVDCDRRGASRDHDRRFARSRRRLRSHDVDRDLTKIAISPPWDCAVNRDRRRGRWTGAREAPRRRTPSCVDRWWFFFWVLSVFF